MERWRAIFALGAVSLVVACSHPLEIVGEGNIQSGTGTRDCYLEEFQAGEENCSVNLVVHDYHETYYAVPREGWHFVAWENYCTDGATANECSFDFDASVVRQFWGQTVPPLVAVFSQNTPPPEPVAMYSYAIDENGFLIDPIPLEGARLERKAVYFTFTGEYQRVNFWCCKVPDGDEDHGDKVEDWVTPFVLRVDLGALPDDAGLPRELYADLFTSTTDYSGHMAYWTLEPLSLDTVAFNDGGTHTIDYTIPGSVTISASTTVNLVDGAQLLSDIVIDGADSTLNVYGGEVYGRLTNGDAETNIYAGDLSGLWNYQGYLNIYGGSVHSILTFGWTNIHGGAVGPISGGYQTLKITAGTIGSLFFESSGRLEISGGTFDGGIVIDNLRYCEVTGGDFQDTFTSKIYGVGCDIKGGQFSMPFVYIEEYVNQFLFTFYGDLELTPIDQWQSQITGTLADGSALSQTVICQFYQWWPGFVGPYCDSVAIVNE